MQEIDSLPADKKALLTGNLRSILLVGPVVGYGQEGYSLDLFKSILFSFDTAGLGMTSRFRVGMGRSSFMSGPAGFQLAIFWNGIVSDVSRPLSVRLEALKLFHANCLDLARIKQEDQEVRVRSLAYETAMSVLGYLG